MAETVYNTSNLYVHNILLQVTINTSFHNRLATSSGEVGHKIKVHILVNPIQPNLSTQALNG